MAVAYPASLALPLQNKRKEQTRKVRESQPLSGPAYTELLSDDAPVFYDLTFTFDQYNALLFRAWVETNGIDKGVEFDIPLRNEGTFFGSPVNETQTVRVVDGDPLSCSNNGIGIYNYSFTVRARKEETGLEDYYDLILEGGLELLLGNAQLDQAINEEAPLD